MKIAYISTYIPKHCHVATFTYDLIKAINYNDHQQIIEQDVFAVSEQKDLYDYPARVVFEIERSYRQDYAGAASIINSGGYDVCLLQHSYDIYGGNSGVYILSFVAKLDVPLLVNLHTVQERPSAEEKAIVKELARYAEKLIVTGSEAALLLQELYRIPNSKITIIPCGVSDSVSSTDVLLTGSDNQGDLSWNKLALRYLDLIRLLRREVVGRRDRKRTTGRMDIPPLDLRHVRRLTNQVGIVQHATYTTPNYHHGYCLDDNARALLLILMADDGRDDGLGDLISVYVSYLYYAQRPDGNFRNFMDFSNQFLEEQGSEDAFGRCIWALGGLVERGREAGFRQIGKEMFLRARPHFKTLRSLRAVAYTIMGLVSYLATEPQNGELINELEVLVHFMHVEYQHNYKESWAWFEEIVSYDNAILPTALLRANIYLKRNKIEQMATDAALFLDEILFRKGFLSCIGNQGWYTGRESVPDFGQQPIEVYTTILLYEELYRRSENPIYYHRMQQAYRWFLGENELHLGLYDPETGGCCDGLELYGVNRNQGAESTICFWLATLHLQYVLRRYPLAKSSFSSSSKFTVA